MIAAAAGALAIGLSLGLFGSGGSILAVPVLIYLLGQDEKLAIAGSLAIVAAVAAAGAIEASRRGAVAWRAAVLFAGAGAGGSAVGALLGARSAAAIQLTVLGCVLLAAALAMAFGRVPAAGAPPASKRPAGKIAVDGILVGTLTGYVGVGGGFLIVPALTILGGLPLHLATGTSLLVIAVTAGSGFLWSLIGHPELAGQLDWPVLGAIAAVGMAGSLAGRRLAGRFDDRVLRRAFAAALVLLAVVVLRDALPGTLATPPIRAAAPGSRRDHRSAHPGQGAAAAVSARGNRRSLAPTVEYPEWKGSAPSAAATPESPRCSKPKRPGFIPWPGASAASVTPTTSCKIPS